MPIDCKQWLGRWTSLLVLATGPFLWWCAPAQAHRVIVFAWVEGDTIHVESKFHGGKHVKGGTVEVSDSSGRRLLSGQTDEQGNFDFKIPQKSALNIAVRAGEGHRGEWRLPLSAIDPAAGGQALKATASSKTDAPMAPGSPSPEAVQQALEAALDKKLKPLMDMVADLRQQGPRLKDILAGLGYIMGLVGIVLYLQARRSQRKDGHDS